MGCMIWLPEISQTDLNVYCAGIFTTVLSHQTGAEKSARDLYRILEARRMAISETFAPRANEILANTIKQIRDDTSRTESQKATEIERLKETKERFDASNPGMFVQMACILERQTGRRISWQGIRFLPAPAKFKPVIEQWIGMLDSKLGSQQWSALMPPEEETEAAEAI